MKNRLLQAYRQAPWRVQLQWIGLFLLVLVLIAAVAGVYLNLSARSATAGRAIQSLERRISNLQREINDLSTQLAFITSADQMYARLEDTDFVLLDPNNALYLEVPGYQPPSNVFMAPPPTANVIAKPVLQPQYTDSLWDWFVNNIWTAPDMPTATDGEVIP